MTDDPFLDDGATEEVASQPRRKAPTAASVTEATAMPVGGRLASMRLAKAQNKQEFTMVRAPLGVTKVALPHLTLLADVWRLWGSKRVTGGDPGVTVAEVASATDRPVGGVRAILATLIRNGIVRSTHTSVGWAGSRARYYPTELGVQVLSIAQMLGPGTSIQVGRTASAWRSRSASEAANIFRHAQFLRGGNS